MFSNVDVGLKDYGVSGPVMVPPQHQQLAATPAPALPLVVASPPHIGSRPQCSQLGCSRIVEGKYELARHEATVHGTNQALHLCPVAECPKGFGFRGYSRADKLTEHMWMKHEDLGYTKCV